MAIGTLSKFTLSISSNLTLNHEIFHVSLKVLVRYRSRSHTYPWVESTTHFRVHYQALLLFMLYIQCFGLTFGLSPSLQCFPTHRQASTYLCTHTHSSNLTVDSGMGSDQFARRY